jgi:HSP20 family protein
MTVESKTEVAVSKPEETKKPVPAHALSPFEEMEHMMERMFEGMFPRGWMRPFRWDRPLLGEFPSVQAWMPKVDLIDREDELVLRAEIPGVDKKDLDISLTRNAVTIKGQTSHEEKEEKGAYYRAELSRGTFTRTLILPADVDTEKAKAEFKDGILELAMPKVEKAKRRSIKLT